MAKLVQLRLVDVAAPPEDARKTVLSAGRWGEGRGMAIIEASDLAEAEALQARDPLVSSGLATYEIARLYPDVPLE